MAKLKRRLRLKRKKRLRLKKKVIPKGMPSKNTRLA